MGMSAWVNVTFYNENNNEIRRVILVCEKCVAKCKEIKIPKDAKSVIVCFTTSYEECENCTDD